jgi:hypothetical protein
VEEWKFEEELWQRVMDAPTLLDAAMEADIVV